MCRYFPKPFLKMNWSSMWLVPDIKYMFSWFIQVVSDLSRQCTYFTYQMCSIYMSWCFDICTHPLADSGPETVFSVLEVMRAAEVASRALSRNLSMDLPPDYTPLSLAEVFYMATMGGARGAYLPTELHKWYAAYQFIMHVLVFGSSYVHLVFPKSVSHDRCSPAFPILFVTLTLLWYTNHRRQNQRMPPQKYNAQLPIQ